MSAARALVEAALAVARERSEVLDRLRLALLRGDEGEALRLARVVTGIEEEDAAGDHPRPS